MRKLLAVGIIATGVILLPLTAVADNDNHSGSSEGGGHPHGSTPLPPVGAGLPGLAAAGVAYFLYRRKRRNK